ncbi:hypothetical protein [Roseateles asaccharophilus]|uniref:Uncharacterized protein YfiM (DUF2279 family) n=1 Tax=Roseateles asaccharophilus TaxID=582607 RepID=A0ABU2AFX7_9BURK|nr:hypothetical protein [Roseateles asaccharophilus]MDR7335367.1 uncharacterized protein YfiM (DUF2279 family) [Roseateles asaccharophilus]
MSDAQRRPGRLRAALRMGLKGIVWLTLALAAAALLALTLAVQQSPRWPEPTAVSAADVARARDFLHRNDPRRPAFGPFRTLIASEREANLMLDQLVRRVAPGGSAQLMLAGGSARLQASLPVPHSPVAAWLNIAATLHETPGLPAIADLRVGRLPVPAWLAERLLPALAARLNATPEGALALDMVRRVRLTPARVEVVYEWGDDGLQRLLGTLLPPAEQARLTAYAQALSGAMQAHVSAGGSTGLPLANLLPPLFTLASQRSVGGDAVAENRAALLTLALQAIGRRMSDLVPAIQAAPQPPHLTMTLAGREDFAQHFLISAALALEGGGPLADAIGVYKETVDLRQGSGFSFNDIAADRAGARLGLLARRDPQALQQRLARGARESDFMPDVADLPEFLGRKEFLATYGGLDAPPYRRMLADIDRRLDALPLLR